jgi:hypothetical protein
LGNVLLGQATDNFQTTFPDIVDNLGEQGDKVSEKLVLSEMMIYISKGEKVQK